MPPKAMKKPAAAEADVDKYPLPHEVWKFSKEKRANAIKIWPNLDMQEKLDYYRKVCESVPEDKMKELKKDSHGLLRSFWPQGFRYCLIRLFKM